jgi:hypothetical protein
MRNFTASLVLLMLIFSNLIFSQTTLTATTGTPILDGVVGPSEWTSTPLVTTAGVTLNAMADGRYLYLSASWTDATGTESIPKKQWDFDGATWSQSGNEDRLGFVWDMGLNGAEGVNCLTMCHPPLMHTQNGNVDVWHWKAARGNAIGVSDDKYWDTSDRQSDPGTSAYQDNDPMGSGFPTYMGTGDPGVNADFLAKDQSALDAFDPFGIVLPAHTVAVAVPFDSTATFSQGDVIAGYVHRIPSGDRASVQAAGKYDNGVWTVEFKKPYAGSEYDFQVVPGSSVEFTHEIFDNEGGNHPNDGVDATIYTLDFSQVFVGIDELISETTIDNYLLEQNYPNPFNPSTTIEFYIPQKSRVSLKVFNVMGQVVKTVLDEEMLPGSYQVLFDSENLASGIYFYNLTTKNYTQTRKMILMK